jgi:hypothetical protein
MREDPRPPATFSEPEAQRILARAAELEATSGNRFTAEDLRQIAVNAGIDEHALEHAISESAAVESRPVLRDASTGMKPSNIAMLAGAGAVLGALAIGADNMSPPAVPRSQCSRQARSSRSTVLCDTRCEKDSPVCCANSPLSSARSRPSSPPLKVFRLPHLR